MSRSALGKNMDHRTSMKRREFLARSAGAMGAACFAQLPLEAMAQDSGPPAPDAWDRGLGEFRDSAVWRSGGSPFV
jgi:hypothetical protein